MSMTDELLSRAAAHANGFDGGGLPAPPALKVAVVACMDARLDPAAALGLRPGDAHVIRNAGGVVTDDAIRSLAISQRKLGTREIVLVHHTKCGMLGLSEDEFRSEVHAETGLRPTWPVEAFDDLDASVRESLARIAASPFLPHKDRVRGFVYDVDTAALREVRRDD